MKKDIRRRFPRNNKPAHYIGRQIRASHVLCINHENENCGVIPISDALKIAESSGLDLVQISSDKGKTPTCKILDYSKFKYEQSKKDKLLKKKQRELANKIKEIKLRPTTGEHDLLTKATHAADFISEGCKVKVTIVFKGREMTHRELGKETMEQFISLIPDANVEAPLSMVGRLMTIVLAKKKDKSIKDVG